jgi:hypothetical protein
VNNSNPDLKIPVLHNATSTDRHDKRLILLIVHILTDSEGRILTHLLIEMRKTLHIHHRSLEKLASSSLYTYIGWLQLL